jgi:hypothetical protein
MTCNDTQLGEAVSKILRCENSIQRCLRDNDMTELWKLLGEVHEQSRLGMYRILDLGGGV